MPLAILYRSLFSLFAMTILPSIAMGADDEEVADGPWISSVAWQGDEQIVGTQSQGLLLRPAQVVTANADAPQDLKVVGEAEFSLWAVLPLDNDTVVAADYKGGVAAYGESEPQKYELDARWIRALAATPDEDQLLAGSEDGKLIVLSVSETKELKRVEAHAAAIFDIAFNAAGDKLATAGGDGQIKVFSWPELEELATMSRGVDAVWSVLFVDDDRHLVSGGADRRIQLWEVEGARSRGTITSTSNWITSLVGLPDSDLVVAGSMDGTVLVVDHRTMQPVVTVDGPGSAIWSLALSPDGKQLAIGTRKHGLAVIDASEWITAGVEAAKKATAIRPPAPRS